jgi:pyruvate dehydrogenase E2 component (dihydrolipoamide acetyltransferase)
MPELLMPKMGDAMEEGTIRRWLKNEGDRIEEEESIAEIDTEKATIEIPATDAGVLTRILVKEGQTVAVGTPIAEVNGKGGSPTPAKPAAEAAPGPRNGAKADREEAPGAEAPAPPTPEADLSQREAAPTNAQAPAAPRPSGTDRVKASPLARKVAEERGVDLQNVRGTGPGGRIIEADVEEALRTGVPGAAPTGRPGPTPAAPMPGTERPMSPIRKVIARRLTESKQTIPHFYLTIDVDMRAAARIRSEYNAGAAEERKVSFNDLVVRACALALEKFPAVNSRLEGEVIKTPHTINVGVAVSLEEGLIVPVVRDANRKSISTLGREIRELAERARKGGLKPDEYAGGTFTISNLGMYDIVQFQAVINPPEAAILAVGAIRDTPVVEEDRIVPGKQMYLTISVDHRIVDGSVAAEFLQEVKRLLQAPLALFG